MPILRWPIRRFVVVDRSMEPTLAAGRGLIALRSSRARSGQLRVVEHPYRPGFWLVKRVGAVLADGRMRVVSDNPDAEGGDSRDFGAVSVTGSYRVLFVI